MRAISSTLLILGLCVAATPTLHATTSFSGTNAGGRTSTYIGDQLTFGIITATAWSTDNTGNTFQAAALGEYSGLGLGVCSKTEVNSGSICTTSPPEHAVGNELGSTGVFDFILLQFSQPVTSISFSLNPFGTQNQEMDYTYFAGSCAPTDLSCTPAGSTLANLSSVSGFGGKLATGGGSANSGSGASSVQTTTLNLGSNSSGVNWILIGTADTGTFNDYFKLNSINYSTSTAPEPATFGLAGAALLGLGLLRRKKLFANR